jgi:ubiquinone/menaquinone biosynthesis C-methylase UbiE
VTSGRVIGYFERQAEGYHSRQSSGVWSRLRQHEAEVVARLLGRVDGLRILDLACGAGYYSRMVTARGGRVVALDLSAGMLAKAREAAGSRCVRADLAALPFHRAFDRVVLAGGLEFVDDPRAVLRQIEGCLADRGEAVVLFPPPTLAGRLYRFYHRAHGLAIHLFAVHELEALAHDAGLLMVEPARAHSYAVVARLRRA